MFIESLGSAALILAYGSLIEPRWLKHVRLNLHLPNLPAKLDGFKVHVVTDLHSTRYGLIEQKIHRLLMAEPVDAVFTLGDYIWRNSNPKHAIKVFENLPSRLGVFGILGNNEHKRRVDTQSVLQALKDGGIQMLVNESVVLEHQGTPFQLIGVDDPYKGRANLAEAIAQKVFVKKPYRILLSHSPQIATDASFPEVDLVFAGHTHGGQIRVPCVGPLLGHNRLEYQLSYGIYTPQKLARIFKYQTAPTLYVSKGIGTGFIHIRLFCRPEITTVTLRSQM